MEEIQSEITAQLEMKSALTRLAGYFGGGVVVDVGANVGDFASLSLECGFTSVFCIEPALDPYRSLVQRFHSSPNVYPKNFAISEVPGVSSLFVTENSEGSSFLRPISGIGSLFTTVVGKQEVDTDRLDTFLMREGIEQCHLLKVDTQGTDLRVLSSSGNLLNGESILAILVEVNFHNFYEGQDSFDEIYSLMVSKGYFLGEFFRRYNRKGWLWCGDALFLPNSSKFSTHFSEKWS